jgi:hypothetical protein
MFHGHDLRNALFQNLHYAMLSARDAVNIKKMWNVRLLEIMIVVHKRLLAVNLCRLRGARVAHLIPVQKVARSNRVGVIYFCRRRVFQVFDSRLHSGDRERGSLVINRWLAAVNILRPRAVPRLSTRICTTQKSDAATVG